MDPVSLVVAALAVGVSAGFSDAAKDAVGGTYGRLKEALIARFGGDAVAAATLARHEADPIGYATPMRDVVAESGAAGDDALVGLARAVLEAADPAGAQVGKYNVQLRDGAVVGAVGDDATVTQTFGYRGT